MANLNKVMLIGRLTRDPETRVFANGGKVANFGFAVNNKKKNVQTGQWDDEPVFLEIKAFNREKGKQLADLVEQYMRKGHQFYIEGHLLLEQWTTQEGQKQSRLKIVMDDFQFLEPRSEGGAPRSAVPARAPAMSSPPEESFEHQPEPAYDSPPPGRSEGDIPF